MELYKQDQYLNELGDFDPDLLQANNVSLTQGGQTVQTGNIYTVIPSLENSSYKDTDFVIVDGKLVYRGTNKDYQDWSKDVNLEVDNGDLNISIISKQNIPVKSGMSVEYDIDISSVQGLKQLSDSKLLSGIKIIDSNNKELNSQPSIKIDNFSYSKNNITAQIVINTTDMQDGKYTMKLDKDIVENEANKANDEIIDTKDMFEIDSTSPIAPVITPSITSPTNGNVIVTITYPSDAAVKQYSYDGKTWTNYTGTLTVSSNCTVYAIAKDNAGNASSQSTLGITNIDKDSPTATINASVSEKTINATITVGDNKQIDYTKSKYMITESSVAYDAENSIWNNATTITKTPFTISQTEAPNDYYIQVLAVDKAGNKVVKVSSELIIKEGNINDTGYNSEQNVNGPVLAKGMTPIKWNGTTPTITTTSDTSWYNYTTSAKQWANAWTNDGSMWVWIPRYEYQITTLEHQASSTSGGNINIKFIQTSQTTADSGYIIEPAFTFGDTQLAGIWVAKFEATAREGVANSAAGDNVTTKHVEVLPNVQSWKNVCISIMFTVCRNMETDSTYGWNTNDASSNGIDTHLMKNVEWGAAAYLAQSSYGKNSEVTINDISSYLTGRGAYASNQGESTTGNIYGIYDMSGGACECVAAYVDNEKNSWEYSDNSLYIADAKYKDVYTPNEYTQSDAYLSASSHKGDAVYETSSSGDSFPNYQQSWYNDYSCMPYSAYLFFKRGGYYKYSTYAGLFYFDYDTGSINNHNGFRPVLAVANAL